MAIYDHTLEIRNPGRLHFGLTIEDLKKAHDSKPWNPTIAKVFYLTGLIEKWGFGTRSIIEICRKSGTTSPDWLEDKDAILFRLSEKSTQQTSQLESQLKSQLESQLESNLFGLNLTQKVQTLLTQYESLSKQEISKLLGQKKVSGQLHLVLKQLIEQKITQYTLPEKPNSRLQKYILTKKDTGC